jgi:tetratricopeptide repeat protein 30
MLSLTAIIVANLCVSYIMVNENPKAEDIMRALEHEEEKAGYDDPTKNVYHLCIVNLVIGTLYCSKSNFDFGIGRIIKSL